VHPLEIGDLTGGFARLRVHDIHFGAVRDVQTPAGAIGDQVVPESLAPDGDLLDLMVAAGRQRRGEK